MQELASASDKNLELIEIVRISRHPWKGMETKAKALKVWLYSLALSPRLCFNPETCALVKPPYNDSCKLWLLLASCVSLPSSFMLLPLSVQPRKTLLFVRCLF